ncbi:nucleolin [Capsicum chacoense]
MLRILGKDLKISKSATMVTRSEAKMDGHDLFEDLSSWEFVNPSDDEHEDSYSFTDHTDGDDDELMVKEDDACEIGSPSSDICMKSEPQSPLPIRTIGALVVCNVGFDYHDDDQEEEEDEDEEDYDDDLDDELVPNWLSDKFERQRIRKLGKRASSRMNKSKKGPYIFNRPGCVRGKHGFGMQHS